MTAEKEPKRDSPMEPPDSSGVAATTVETAPAETEAAIPGEEAAPAAADPSRSPRRIAWLLGSNLSVAALANERGVDPDKVASWFDKAQRLATLVGTSIAPLPPRLAEGETATGDRDIQYLFSQGQGIGRDLAAGYGDDAAALLELAVKSNVLLVTYQPDMPGTDGLATAIEQAGERAQLPEELWRPLIQSIDEGAPAATVRKAVSQMHVDVDQYLSTAQPSP